MSEPEYAVDYTPFYHFQQEIAASPQLFKTAHNVAQLILNDTFSLTERQLGYGGIACRNDCLPAAFTRTIPGTQFSSFDINRTPPSLETFGITQLSLYDADSKGRVITLIEMPPKGPEGGDFAISDSKPNRQPRSGIAMSRTSVRDFLQLQLYGPDRAPTNSQMSLGEICDALAPRSRTYHQNVDIGGALLGNGMELRVERSIIHEPRPAAGVMTRSEYKVAIHGEVDESLVAARAVGIKTIAQFSDALRSRDNKFSYEVEADILKADNDEVFTQSCIRKTEKEQRRILATFIESLRSYQRSVAE